MTGTLWTDPRSAPSAPGTSMDDGPVIGSLCSGYGGLEMAVLAVFGGRVAWHCETDPNAMRILRARFPGVPNLGDITRIDWTEVRTMTRGGNRRDDERAERVVPQGAPAVDILTAGFPERLASRGPTPDFEAVLATLATSGPPLQSPFAHYDPVSSCWRTCEASFDEESGAPMTIWPCSVTTSGRFAYRLRQRAPRTAGSGGSPSHGLLPTPRVWVLLPTPCASNRNDGEDPQVWLERAERLKAKGINGNGAGMPLAVAAALLPTPNATHGRKTSRTGPLLSGVDELLPTPRHRDGRGCRPGANAEGGVDLGTAAQSSRWGRYAAAVSRWEAVTGHPAPEPTVPGTKGQPTLNPRLSEWMMGIPPGWLNVPGVPASAQRAAAGNGVVPAQAALALRILLDLP